MFHVPLGETRNRHIFKNLEEEIKGERDVLSFRENIWRINRDGHYVRGKQDNGDYCCAADRRSVQVRKHAAPQPELRQPWTCPCSLGPPSLRARLQRAAPLPDAAAQAPKCRLACMLSYKGRHPRSARPARHTDGRR